MRFQVLSPYIVADGEIWPQVAYQLASQVAWSDVTGIPNDRLIPSPNLVVVEITAPRKVYDLIAAEASYFILWSEEL